MVHQCLAQSKEAELEKQNALLCCCSLTASTVQALHSSLQLDNLQVHLHKNFTRNLQLPKYHSKATLPFASKC